jgi:hypothetical protein
LTRRRRRRSRRKDENEEGRSRNKKMGAAGFARKQRGGRSYHRL